MAIERLRGRMPLLAFLLLAVVCLLLVGFACTCLDEQLAQTLDRAFQTQHLAATEAWHPLGVLALAVLSATVLVGPASSRASPASLQRFLF